MSDLLPGALPDPGSIDPTIDTAPQMGIGRRRFLVSALVATAGVAAGLTSCGQDGKPLSMNDVVDNPNAVTTTEATTSTTEQESGNELLVTAKAQLEAFTKSFLNGDNVYGYEITPEEFARALFYDETSNQTYGSNPADFPATISWLKDVKYAWDNMDPNNRVVSAFVEGYKGGENGLPPLDYEPGFDEDAEMRDIAWLDWIQIKVAGEPIGNTPGDWDEYTLTFYGTYGKTEPGGGPCIVEWRKDGVLTQGVLVAFSGSLAEESEMVDRRFLQFSRPEDK